MSIENFRNESSRVNVNHIKKGNLWYPPTKSLYSFLTRVERLELPKTFAVLGCADGNYVVPAARRGFEVLAIDIDTVALYGGRANIGGKDLEIIGMKKKLERLGLEEKVNIVRQSYLDYQPETTFSGVIVSESTHYQANSRYSLDERIAKIQSYLSIGGLFLLEYLHLSDRNSDLERFFTSKSLKSYFKPPQWKLISNKIKVYLEEPNIRNNSVHEINLGRLYSQKIK